MHGIITDITPFSVNDGPGIRTSVFLKGCPLHCRWCHNPEGQLPGPQVMVQPSRCVGCGACAVCPSGARGVHGELDPALCTGCGLCVSVCPAEACRITGREMSPEEVLAQVLPDKPFFRGRGGVTISGGEPMAQPAFTLALASLLHAHGIGVVLETCGYAPWECFEAVAPFVTCFLYDWKITDPELHRRWTGSDNLLIRDNLAKLHDLGAVIILRCPVIPGVNDTPEHFDGIVRLVKELPRIRQVDLLPYHTLGNSKRIQLGMPRSDFPVPGQETAKKWRDELAALCSVPVYV